MRNKIRFILAVCISMLIMADVRIVIAEDLSGQPYKAEKAEFRGAWIATVGNIDWPSKKGLSAEKMKSEFVALMDKAQELKLNAVIVQVRPTADAFYKSELNPWSEYLTGTQGKDPGFDPLEFMLKEAHSRNIELHAWFNPFRVSNTATQKTWAENSVAKQHPGWLVNYDNKKFIDPGIPEAREHVLQSVMEVVRNYDIDAVHFDDYFYPYPVKSGSFPDNASYQSYNRGIVDRADWRRDNINLFIESVYESIKSEKPHVKFGVSPFGIWRSKKDDPDGIDTTSDMGSYDSVYADTRLWIRNGWLDYVAPQIYWEFAHKSAPYAKALDFWVNELAKAPSTQLYIGHAVYKIGTAGSTWLNAAELPNQLKYNQGYSTIRGSIFYNFSSLNKDLLGFTTELKSNLYRYPALVPSTSANDPPNPVVISALNSDGTKNELKFTTDGSNTSYFVIYRSSGVNPPDTSNPANILCIVRYDGQTAQTFSDKQIVAGERYTYRITSVDRLHSESAPSNAMAITAK